MFAGILKGKPPRFATPDSPRRVSILGATGSVGCITCDVLEGEKELFEVEALVSYGNNVSLLAEKARRLRASVAVVADTSVYSDLKDALAGSGIEVAAGEGAVLEAAGRQGVDLVVSAMVGAVGLQPTLAAIRAGASIALANKECLVTAGEFFMKEAARWNVCVIPIDSEHSAIFQALMGASSDRHISRIILTASGGPFREWSLEQMRDACPEDALIHPNFSMGKKISVDSATMMNKGLELIEASYLFGMQEKEIEILVHPQQIIHGMVEFSDGSVLAQLGVPDMKIPVSVALAWPERLQGVDSGLDLVATGCLTFEAQDPARFPALALAKQAMRAGGAATCVLNAANEVAVWAFLEGKIGFLEIVGIVSSVLDSHAHERAQSLEEYLALDLRARCCTEGLIL